MRRRGKRKNFRERGREIRDQESRIPLKPEKEGQRKRKKEEKKRREKTKNLITAQQYLKT